MAAFIKKHDAVAIVVTYNRLEKLKICIEALKNQSFSGFDLCLVDNCCTDETPQYLRSLASSETFVLHLDKNTGGSGGFYMGLKWAYEHGYKYAWIMDDDVKPTKTALAELFAHTKYVKIWSFLASCVYTEAGDAINTPEISLFKTNGYRFWYEKLEHGMVRLAHATFVSLLINLEAVQKCGLPCKDYFIWGDDTEYTQRIVGKFGAAYLVGKSKVYHLRESGESLSIASETKEGRIPMFRHLVRNTLTNASAYGGQGADKRWIKKYEAECRRIAELNVPFKGLKIATIKAGIEDYVNGNYSVEGFKHRYEIYGQARVSARIAGLPNIVPFFVNSFDDALHTSTLGLSLLNHGVFFPDFLAEFLRIELKDEAERIVPNFQRLMKGAFSYNDYVLIEATYDDLDKVTLSRPGESISFFIERKTNVLSALRKAADKYGYLMVNGKPTQSEIEYALLVFAEAFRSKTTADRCVLFVDKNSPMSACISASLTRLLGAAKTIEYEKTEKPRAIFERFLRAIGE